MNNGFINQGTAFDIIARCLNLTHKHDNIFTDASGKILILTKYGFQESMLFSHEHWEKVIFKEKATMMQEINLLRKENNKANEEIEKVKREITICQNLLIEVDEEGETSKNGTEKKNINKIVYIVGKKDITDKEKIDMIKRYTSFIKNH